MAIKIIDNKKIDLTDDEWVMYQKICRSYDGNNRKGEDLFVDLFESNNSGIIMYLKPPSNRFCSMEVYLFIMSIFQHQHTRLMHEEVSSLCNELREKINKVDENLKAFNIINKTEK